MTFHTRGPHQGHGAHLAPTQPGTKLRVRTPPIPGTSLPLAAPIILLIAASVVPAALVAAFSSMFGDQFSVSTVAVGALIVAACATVVGVLYSALLAGIAGAYAHRHPWPATMREVITAIAVGMLAAEFLIIAGPKTRVWDVPEDILASFAISAGTYVMLLRSRLGGKVAAWAGGLWLALGIIAYVVLKSL